MTTGSPADALKSDRHQTVTNNSQTTESHRNASQYGL
jgi:hypothetical protein